MKIKNLQELLRGEHGGFLAALAEAFTKADSKNQQAIIQTWPTKFIVDTEPALYKSFTDLISSAPEGYYWVKHPKSPHPSIDRFHPTLGFSAGSSRYTEHQFYGPLTVPVEFVNED